MMIIMGEFQILGMIRNSVPKINDLQRYQEGKWILKYVVVCHCHENRGQCEFRIGIEKVKDEGCGKRGWSTTMVHCVNGTTDGGAMQEVGVGGGEDELIAGEGHEHARYEGHVQTRCDRLETLKVDRETEGNRFGCQNGQIHTDQYFPLTGGVSSFRDALDIV